MSVRSFEVLNKIFCFICLSSDAWNFFFNVKIHGRAHSIILLYKRRNNIFSHRNDNREFYLPWKGITYDKHAIIPWSSRTRQSQGDLIISSQKLSSLKDIYCTSAQKRMPSNISDWCVDTLKKSPYGSMTKNCEF